MGLVACANFTTNSPRHTLQAAQAQSVGRARGLRAGMEARALVRFTTLLVAVLAAAADMHYPRMGIHDGDNKVVWTSDCCDGDLVVIDFRDSHGDGNQGTGVLRLVNETSGAVATYEIGPFWGMHKAFGPYCAPPGRHSISFTSDGNEKETGVTVTDSFGLVRAKGGMADLPMEFNTSAPNKYCLADEDLPLEAQKEAARKAIAYKYQFYSRAEVERLGETAPFDLGYTVLVPVGG